MTTPSSSKTAAPDPATPKSNEPFRFPTHITTKKAAIEFADKLFPPQPANELSQWWRAGKTTPEEQWNRLREIEERFQNMLEWLYDDDGRMRIYRSPRTRHFWYRIRQNLFWNITDARNLVDTCFERERFDKRQAAVKSATTMEDGQGI